jgi:acyl carrier protein
MSNPKFEVNETPGGPAPSGSYYAEPPVKSHGCFFYGCIIALVGSGLCVLALVIGLVMLRNFANRQIREYTETAPATIPAVTASAEEKKAVKDRWDTFKKAVEEGKQSELVLTADDLNVLIEQNPTWKGKVHFTIKGEEISAQVSIPLSEWNVPLLDVKGRYLNGNATITAEVDENGHLDVRLRDIEVKGNKMPDNLKASFADENLAKSFSRDPNNQRMLRRLRSIKVKNSKIIIRSRAKEEPGAHGPAPADVAARVVKIIREQFNVSEEKVTPDTTFKQLGADELDVSEIVQEVEEEFDIDVPDDVADRFKTVGEMIGYVKSKVAEEEKPAAPKTGPAIEKKAEPAPVKKAEPPKAKEEKEKTPAGNASRDTPQAGPGGFGLAA